MASASNCDPQRSDELRIATDSTTSIYDAFASGPEIDGDNTFDFEKENNIVLCADKLALEAKSLIDLLKTVPSALIHSPFQIELRKTYWEQDQSSTFKMVLRIDSILWFEDRICRDSDFKKSYNIALEYAEKVKKEITLFSGIMDENAIKRVAIGRAVEWCITEKRGRTCPFKNDKEPRCHCVHYEWCLDENVGSSGKCVTPKEFGDHKKKWHTSTIRDDDKPAYQCRQKILKLNRKYEFCLFQVEPDLWIYEGEVEKPSSYPYFIVGARHDATPIITLNPVKHCKNEEFVKSSDAWQAVLQTLRFIKSKLRLDKLPMRRIYVNFGKWMQQKQDDAMNTSCHAHINIELTRETIDKITDINLPSDNGKRRKKLFPSLAGSLIPPKAHSLDDTRQLIAHMNNHMIPLLIVENRELLTKTAVLERELGKLKFEYDLLRKSMAESVELAQEEDAETGGEPLEDNGPYDGSGVDNTIIPLN